VGGSGGGANVALPRARLGAGAATARGAMGSPNAALRTRPCGAVRARAISGGWGCSNRQSPTLARFECG